MVGLGGWRVTGESLDGSAEAESLGLARRLAGSKRDLLLDW